MNRDAYLQIFPNLFGGIDGSLERNRQRQAGAVAQGQAILLSCCDQIAGDPCLFI
jgi:hypothetical protein